MLESDREFVVEWIDEAIELMRLVRDAVLLDEEKLAAARAALPRLNREAAGRLREALGKATKDAGENSADD